MFNETSSYVIKVITYELVKRNLLFSPKLSQ
nr:MAG TPA: hypothetical protein [Caudoviricetes sp.]